MKSAAILVVRDGSGYGRGLERYVDVRIDDHPNPIEEPERIFKIYDITLLSRENSTHPLSIQSDISLRIQQALVALGFLQVVDQDSFSEAAKDALQKYIAINNFENKIRKDSTIWQSLYEYLLSDAGLAP